MRRGNLEIANVAINVDFNGDVGYQSILWTSWKDEQIAGLMFNVTFVHNRSSSPRISFLLFFILIEKIQTILLLFSFVKIFIDNRLKWSHRTKHQHKPRRQVIFLHKPFFFLPFAHTHPSLAHQLQLKQRHINTRPRWVIRWYDLLSHYTRPIPTLITFICYTTPDLHQFVR